MFNQQDEKSRAHCNTFISVNRRGKAERDHGVKHQFVDFTDHISRVPKVLGNFCSWAAE